MNSRAVANCLLSDLFKNAHMEAKKPRFYVYKVIYVALVILLLRTASITTRAHNKGLKGIRRILRAMSESRKLHRLERLF